MSSQKRGTRQQLLDRLREHGIPLGKSTLDKLCAPSVHQGPPVAAWWGRRPLYDFDKGIEWAEQRLKAQPNGSLPDANRFVDNRNADSSPLERRTKAASPMVTSKLTPSSAS